MQTVIEIEHHTGASIQLPADAPPGTAILIHSTPSGSEHVDIDGVRVYPGEQAEFRRIDSRWVLRRWIIRYQPPPPFFATVRTNTGGQA